MSRSITSWLAGIVAVVLLASSARAQHYQPFIEPGFFDYDIQLFAPATEIDTYGGTPVLRTGWFGSYNRMYMGVSRPDVVQSFDMMDLTWGNRWDLGYMTDDDHGWLFNYTHIDGPNAAEVVRQQRLNRLNEDDEGRPEDPDDDADPVEPPSDRNNSGPPNRERFYDITNTLNGGIYNSLEINKLFRTAPLMHGGVLEPFFGFRYTRFRDVYIQQDYQVYDDLGLQPVFPPIPPFVGDPPPPIDYRDSTIEDLLSEWYELDNQMIGGQLGLRWLKRTSRWNLSSEFRAFAFQNFQHLTATFEDTRTYYDGQGAGSEVDAILRYKDRADFHTTETVVGTDIRAEAAYELTRDISLTVGMQFLGFFTGIGRGGDISENSEDLIMIGSTFGFVWNR